MWAHPSKNTSILMPYYDFKIQVSEKIATQFESFVSHISFIRYTDIYRHIHLHTIIICNGQGMY